MKIRRLPNQSGSHPRKSDGCLIDQAGARLKSGSSQIEIRQLPNWSGGCQIKIRQLPDRSRPRIVRSLLETLIRPWNKDLSITFVMNDIVLEHSELWLSLVNKCYVNHSNIFQSNLLKRINLDIGYVLWKSEAFNAILNTASYHFSACNGPTVFFFFFLL